MNHLLILNDPLYGTERSFNGLRMTHSLAKNDAQVEITVFLMADAVLGAETGQKAPEGLPRHRAQDPSGSLLKGTRPEIRERHDLGVHRCRFGENSSRGHEVRFRSSWQILDVTNPGMTLLPCKGPETDGQQFLT